jgi:hypothetical protein
LKQFFDRADRESRTASGVALDGMLKYDRDNPPKDNEKGWVIEIRGTTWQKDNRKFIIDSLVHNLTYFARGQLPVSGAAPPPAPPQQTSPDGKKEPIDPITERVSHAFLFNYRTDHDPKPGSFLDIGQTFLPPLVAGGGGGGADGGRGETPPSAPGVTVASGRDSWKPLLGGSAGAGGLGGGGPPTSTGSIGRVGKSPAMSESAATNTGATGPTGPEGGATARKGRPRYEFIVMFIWREPTPSDALMKPEGAPTPQP